MKKIKWYETFDLKTRTRKWWTQRDQFGVCFEIKTTDNSVSLYINERFHDKYETVAEAKKIAEGKWNKGVIFA